MLSQCLHAVIVLTHWTPTIGHTPLENHHWAPATALGKGNGPLRPRESDSEIVR